MVCVNGNFMDVVDRFERMVAALPAQEAVACGDRSLSYTELERQVQRLAGELVAAGASAETLVALALEASIELVVAQLAVLKSGAAFLALDPRQPQERLRELIADSGASLLIDAAGITGLAPASSARSQCVHPEQLAYVIYTSGSTGRPKAVGVSRAALAYHCSTVAERYGLSPADRVLRAASAGVDVALEQTLPALISGATVIVPDGDWGALDLVTHLRRLRPTVADLMPAYAQFILDTEPDARLDSVRLLLLGGDVVKPSDVLAWRRILRTEARIMNAYGVTEATITSLVHEVDAIAETEVTVPIGAPLSGARIVVLDDEMRPVPAGTPGELCIGGAGLARGYIGQPARTAECFVPDPCGASGERLYRTGDRCLVRADGTVVFLGRADFQVKVRGFRVELGEVEAAVVAHPLVRECVVTKCEERLVAYVRADGDVRPAELRKHTQARLPEYMVPAAFVRLATFPLTPNGKLDRHALPAPAREDFAAADDTPLATDLQRTIAEAWREVLGVERIGLRDNFFALGGDSISAMRVISQIRRRCGRTLRMSEFFAAPVLEDLAACLASPASDDGSALSDRIAALKAPHQGDAALAYAQQRLWFLHQYEPESDQYNVATAFRVQGPLRLDALRQALEDIVARHEVLRSGFRALHGRPSLHIASAAHVPWEVVDLTWLGKAATREQEAKRRAREFAKRPFDLSAPPLLRVLAMEIDAGDWLLVIVQHHIVTDWWSQGRLLAEWGEAYAAQIEARPARLPVLDMQYVDYAVWQQRWLAGAELERQLAYWRGRLADYEPTEVLPDRPRPPVRSGRGASLDFWLDAELSGALRSFGGKAGATSYMVLMAAVALLLAKYTGRHDIAFGAAFAGRGRSELENLLGFFVNTLVMRLDLSGNPSGAELLRRVRETALAAYDHADLPFEKLVEELSIERDPSRTPLFQLMCILQTPAPVQLELAGLRVEEVELPTETAPFDLTVELVEVGAALRGRIVYARDLFTEPTIARLARSLEHALRALAEHPARRLSEISLLTGDERQQLEAWARAPWHYAEGGLAQRHFEAQARLQPDAVAVVCNEDALSYGELNDRAEQIAGYLRSRGMGPDRRVGVHVDRSLDLVAGMLAVLKAEAVYVPLDPELPAERLAFMVADAGVEVILSDRDVGPEIACGADVIRLDDDWSAIERAPASNVPWRSDPDDLAYIIYTSGSTGRPKGVMVSKRSLDEHTLVMRDVYAFEPRDRVLHFLGQGFDVSLEQVLTTLASGAGLVLRGMERWSATDLLRRVDYHGITVLHLTPSHWRGVLAQLESAAHPVQHVRVVIVGGEQMSRADAYRSQRAFRGARHLNVYGPTEATITCVVHDIGAIAEGEGAVPIGKPIGGARVLVLDQDLCPVPIGAPGELYIGGLCLARGYSCRTDLTAERFVPDPFGSGERLYRTGDRCAWRSDGTLEFIGRVDFQVKVRGYRIEPGEIEVIVATHPLVRECVVVVDGDQRLVAYVRVAAEVGPAELREHVKARLPEYMVPGAFVRLTSFPLTPNGKIDRKALPEPARDDLAAHDNTPLSTALERTIAEVWRKVLGVDRIGLHDNFFALGGQSLLATEAVARLNEILGIDLSLRTIFQDPTVASLAQRIEQQPQARQALPEIVRSPAASGRSPATEAPLSFAQESLWLMEQWHPGTALYNIPIALRVSGPLDIVKLKQALGEIVARHDALRTVFPRGGGPVQRVIADVQVPFSVIDVADQSEAEMLRLAARAVQEPFNLERAPLLRASLYRRSPSDHLLLLTIHHLVADGWSLDLLTGEIATLYAGRQCTELTLQYPDYAAWQRHSLAADRVPAQLAYWQARLAGAPSLLALPIDKPRALAPSFTGAIQRFQIAADVACQLAALAQGQGASLFMLLLAGYALALHRWTGQDDLLIGTPIANRNRTELEPLIGLFLNTLVIRSAVRHDARFAGFVADTKKTVLDAYEHQDVPFEQIVDALGAVRDPARPPLVQAWFAFHNTRKKRLELPGLRLEEVQVHDWPVHYELQLDFWPDADGIRGEFLYRADLFEPATVQELAFWLERLFATAAARADLEIRQLLSLVAGELTGQWAKQQRDLEQAGAAKLAQLMARRSMRTGGKSA